MSTDLDREEMDTRGDDLSRGDFEPRGDILERGELTRTLTRHMESTAEEEALSVEIQHLAFAGKKIGSPIVVFPDNIANGAYVPGTLIRIFDGIVQVSVGTVVIQDGAWKPVRPFVAGDQVFIPIRSIDAFV